MGSPGEALSAIRVGFPAETGEGPPRGHLHVNRGSAVAMPGFTLQATGERRLEVCTAMLLAAVLL